MNIKEAKNEVKRAVKIYLEKDENGEYKVPIVRQRPLFLVGAPGIGKTAIMEQVAAELDIALVSYSMTHHTRQSAIGLPYLKEVEYGGKSYTKSEYTMSEIIASIYEVIERTEKKEGILFLDEVNCVSETLAPSMLLFLQYKRFGNQSVPEGWVVVTAGNPPQYNKSVKEFDIATMDRLKMLDIEASFSAWKEYAYNAGIHPAIISFLEANPNNFYRINSTVDGKEYITARGWEDLSTEIQAYERHGFDVNEELIREYITNKECSRKFAIFYDLFKKYRMDYSIDDIFTGNFSPKAIDRAQKARFDERLSLISMLMDGIGSRSKKIMTEYSGLMDTVTRLRKIKKDKTHIHDLLIQNISEVREEMDKLKTANSLSNEKKAIFLNTIHHLEHYLKLVAMEPGEEPFSIVKKNFDKDTKALDLQRKKISEALENTFTFISKAWNEDQEMTLFTTELTVNKSVAEFISVYGSKSYFKNNSSLLVKNEEEKLNQEIENFLDENITFEDQSLFSMAF